MSKYVISRYIPIPVTQEPTRAALNFERANKLVPCYIQNMFEVLMAEHPRSKISLKVEQSDADSAYHIVLYAEEMENKDAEIH